jgi:pimeloyl-ACP methyl ester carboxylesterase
MTPTFVDQSEYPFAAHYFKVNGQNLHYIDEGEGDVILFVHGTPSWSFDFRNIIKMLRPHYRCIAIDHIGFGLSDKPSDYDYSTLNHSETLAKFIEEKELDNFTLVVHDFGGPIGLNYAIQHPDKVKNMVVLNSWMWSSAKDPEFIKFSSILKSPILPFLYLYFNFSPRFLLPQSFGDHKLAKHLHAQYTNPFANSSQRKGTLAFAKSLVHDQDWFEELWKQRHHISNKPTLFIWGMKDRFVTPRYLEKFLSGFTNAHAERLETCGHFPQEEQSDKVGRWIEAFLKFGLPLPMVS